ncbi:MAG: rod shape-determining protein MreD [Bacteroidales bacterium]|nr:rod shape-determining protein MreD [Bacteroidales bacterium]
MTGLYLNNIIRFILLVIVQVLILNNINFGGYVNPFLYVYFILLLPFETAGWLLLISSFLIGLTIDIFSGTPGMHASASALIAFFRPAIIKIIGSSREYETGMQPSIRDLGFRWFITYSFFMILIHHTALFMVEVFRLSGLFDTVKRAIFSTIFTLVLVIITQYLFSRTTRRK